MRTPCLNYLETYVDRSCQDKTMSQLTPRQEVMTRLAWLGDNFDYLNRDFMQGKVKELIEKVAKLSPSTMDVEDDIPF